ncbi:MAG: hypothetical protein B5M53_00170 [Candidatus Cloacimonas sp. 4484_209]|nr:MAG: hypothetical protein B5M53_00170 [Candidatus Cloacimonas sp. 4484_209]
MEITVGLFIFIAALAFCCEYIDSSLGMGYGTILSPVLIIMGFNPLIVVPSLLLSQAVGGFTASIFHHGFRNVDFRSSSKDLKIVFIITSFGIVATVFAAIIAINIPKIIVKTYIGLLVMSMGIILLTHVQFKFSWKKIMGIGVLSSFNKGLTGGGFGPVVTSGQIISGQRHKGAIGVTTLAEAPVCTVAFFTYVIGRVVKEIKGPILNVSFKDFFLKIFSKNILQWELLLALLLGSIAVAPFGAFTTRKMKTEKLRIILGILVLILGIWTLVKTYF